jgi:MFS family permease
MVPLEQEFGWPRTLMSSAVSLNLVLYGLMAPFAAALMDRFGIRWVTSLALVLAAGSGLTIVITQGWQLMITWGLLIGLGTGSMAMVFAATIANRWSGGRGRTFWALAGVVGGRHEVSADQAVLGPDRQITPSPLPQGAIPRSSSSVILSGPRSTATARAHTGRVRYCALTCS